MYVSVPHACVAPLEVRKECRISWAWSNAYEPPCRCLKLAPGGPLQEQLLLAAWAISS